MRDLPGFAAEAAAAAPPGLTWPGLVWSGHTIAAIASASHLSLRL